MVNDDARFQVGLLFLEWVYVKHRVMSLQVAFQFVLITVILEFIKYRGIDLTDITWPLF